MRTSSLSPMMLLISSKVFLIDGIITLPIAFFGFFWFPDLPESTKAPYFSGEEKHLALSRLPLKNPDGHNIGFSLIKRVLSSPDL